MFRILSALTVGGILIAATFAAAASVKVESGAIQAGSDPELQCDTDGLGITYQSSSGGLTWDQATVSDIDQQCTGKIDLSVLVNGSGATVLAKGNAGCVEAKPEMIVKLTDPLTQEEAKQATTADTILVTCG